MSFIQASLFDAPASEAAKKAGMQQAADSNKSLLEHARKVAVELAQRGPITADDVQRRLVEQGISEKALGNAAGSLFKGKQWVWTGRLVKSSRVHAHSNLLREWRLNA